MDGGAGSDAAAPDAVDAVDMAGETGDVAGDTSGDGGLTGPAARGQYLVNNVLGCSGCHTPKAANGSPDTTRFLAGVDCFVNSGGNCLSSANLTNDATGLKNFSDDQIKAAFTAGIDPESGDAGTKYLFATMPYYQFAFLTSADADAIVAYLRTVTGVSHMAADNTGTFATQPTSPQWAPVSLAALPSAATPDGGVDGGIDAAVASTSNGKYLAALLCSTCHTVNTDSQMPMQIDVSKAFEGGKVSTTNVQVPVDAGADAGDAGDAGDAATTMTVSKMIESANLTPDVTGLAAWTPAQITNAISKAQDQMGRPICGMRAFGGLLPSDVSDIVNYLQAIPAASNPITMTCY
jgi:mono/diheme cytochrome c family protein